jgi:hypothetical protein
MKSTQEYFPITSLHQDHLQGVGFDTSDVDDATMVDLAGKLADDYCDQLFWQSLEIIADRLDIPRRKAVERKHVSA